MVISKYTSGYKHWKALKQRCNDKNASNYKFYGAKGIICDITLDEINKLWELYNAKDMIEPQLSRNDHNKNYTFDNCYFSNKKKNVGERNSRILSKKVYMYHYNLDFIKKFQSVKEAAKFINKSPCSISDVIHKRSKTCSGFVYSYERF